MQLLIWVGYKNIKIKMINTTLANNINDAFIDICKALYYHGKKVSPRGMETLELQNYLVEFDANADPTITIPERKLNIKYLSAELSWYKSGDPSISFISKYSTFWEKLTDNNNTVNSNYGKLALVDKYNGSNQYEWCMQQLLKDPNTRQAIINYNQPQHKYPTNKDFVCTIAQQFIVNEGKLDTIVFMRSNDLIYGFSYDVPWFNYLHKKLAKHTNLPLGSYRHFATSMHVYKRHFKMIEKVATKY